MTKAKEDVPEESAAAAAAAPEPSPEEKVAEGDEAPAPSASNDGKEKESAEETKKDSDEPQEVIKADKSKENAEDKAEEEAPAAAAAAPEADTEAPTDAPAEAKKPEEPVEEEDTANAIWEPADADVLSGRGASVNAHQGNKKFRSLCFARKPEFEAGNHAAKRRVATEIVNVTFDNNTARFLKKKNDKGPWYEMTKEQAILKACQVMRDYKRPDRVAMREMMQQNGSTRKRSRSQEPSTPLLDASVPTGPLDPIIENPFGVHNHDILSGRGAFVNGHVGNHRLRTLAMERKPQFDSGNYTEKRALAAEIVQIIRSLTPPGRFLKKVAAKKVAAEKAKETGTQDGDAGADDSASKDLDPTWEELPDEKAIHKACQVMRDIDRPDRKDRELRRAKKKQKLLSGEGKDTTEETPVKEGEEEKEGEKKEGGEGETKDSAMDVLAKTTAEKAAVEEAVAATEEILDKTLEDSAEEAKQKAEEAEAIEV